MGRNNNNDWTKLCAFWGIVIAAALFVVKAILGWLGGNLGLIETICDIVAKIALIIAIALPAYGFVRYKKMGWKIVYWVALVIYVVFIFLVLVKI